VSGNTCMVLVIVKRKSCAMRKKINYNRDVNKLKKNLFGFETAQMSF
jgi:hypothetical protein